MTHLYNFLRETPIKVGTWKIKDRNVKIILIWIKINRNMDRLQNKYTNYKGIKNNTNFGKITGIQEKRDTTCK
jgi:hypothetical protein